MKQALRRMPPETPQIPDGIVQAYVNRRTGQTASPGDPEAMQEFFLRNDSPTIEPVPFGN
jgi:membrane carboxypeptidase/penicillin-binding protein